MIWITAAVASLFAARVYGAPGSIVEDLLGAGRPTLESRMENMAYGALQRRQNTNTPLNMTQWNADTMAACMATLSTLPTASNPSGMAVCYNLPQLDTNTGSFMADLRLFQVSTPSGAFAGIPPQQIQGGVVFNGATASEVNGQPVAPRDMKNSFLVKRQASAPTLLRTYMIVGKINSDQMVPPMTMEKIEPLVMPIFTLSAKNAAGDIVTTNVSSNEATFVNGIFSREVVLSTFSMASLSVQNATAELKAGKVAFVLPGVNILIFPVGLVFTGVWTLAGVGAYAFGTYERYNYRESYRRRKALSGSKSYATRI
ncbi:hypothetical protein F5Y19DRAFT_446015 [Xylariaceae sp. FL1651]|nr:hypothetical protein F5Y19DRAFT_446015 [Xylariaceae sp. FL1651]